ncbi:MAG: hypothetical protein H6621_07445 [Halobacteriovoraceae bacterium]|nr:hypothetical protein [Halobacteriovoraceae bacterium]
MRKLMKIYAKFLFFLIFFISGCSTDGDGAISLSEVIATVDEEIVSVGNLIDDLNGEDFNSESLKAALVDACSSRAIDQTCSSGVRTANYNECTLGSTQITFEGQVTLSYSNSLCDLSDNENVIRTFNLVRTNPLGSTVLVTSQNRVNYEGDTIGGGSKLFRLSSSNYELKILGKNLVRTLVNGNVGYNISMATDSNIEISGGLSRSSRTLNSGELYFYHNNSQYTARYTFQDVGYQSACCYPTSGSIDIEYSGNKSGSATITFNNSCGNATIDIDDETSAITFDGCEY